MFTPGFAGNVEPKHVSICTENAVACLFVKTLANVSFRSVQNHCLSCGLMKPTVRQNGSRAGLLAVFEPLDGPDGDVAVIHRSPSGCGHFA